MVDKKKSKKSKIIITVVCIVGIILVAFIGLVISSGVKQNKVLKTGDEFYAKGEYDKAIEYYTIGIGETGTTKLALGLIKRGQAYLAKGDLDNAVIDFKDYLIRIPGSEEVVDLLMNIGIEYVRDENIDKAINVFSTIIESIMSVKIIDTPKKNVAYGYRGECYYLKGEWENAISDFTELLKTDVDNIYAKDYIEMAKEELSNSM